HPGQFELARDLAREQAAVAAKSDQAEIARVLAAFGGYGADRARHVRDRDPVYAVAERHQVDAEWPRDFFAQGGFRARRIERNCAAGKPRRTEITEQEARIGERGLGASEAVTGGTRMGPRTFRTDLERAAAIEPHD